LGRQAGRASANSASLSHFEAAGEPESPIQGFRLPHLQPAFNGIMMVRNEEIMSIM